MRLLAACLFAIPILATAAEPVHPPRNVLLFVADGLRPGMINGTDRADNDRAVAAGRDLHQHPRAVPDLHHAQRLGHRDRPHAR